MAIPILDPKMTVSAKYHPHYQKCWPGDNFCLLRWQHHSNHSSCHSKDGTVDHSGPESSCPSDPSEHRLQALTHQAHVPGRKVPEPLPSRSGSWASIDSQTILDQPPTRKRLCKFRGG